MASLRVWERERVERDTIIVLVLVAKCDEQGMDKACAIDWDPSHGARGEGSHNFKSIHCEVNQIENQLSEFKLLI